MIGYINTAKMLKNMYEQKKKKLSTICKMFSITILIKKTIQLDVENKIQFITNAKMCIQPT